MNNTMNTKYLMWFKQYIQTQITLHSNTYYNNHWNIYNNYIHIDEYYIMDYIFDLNIKIKQKKKEIK